MTCPGKHQRSPMSPYSQFGLLATLAAVGGYFRVWFYNIYRERHPLSLDPRFV